MTLPASFPLSMSQISNELGLSFPISISHSWVLKLAQIGSLPISFNQLLGKTGRFDGSPLCNSGGGGLTINLGAAPWFGGQLNFLTESFSPAGTTLAFNAAPNWNGNILVSNNTTSVSLVLGQLNGSTWTSGSAPSNLLRAGQSDSITILPSN
ncbi:hypothetical protein [Burkholderia stagnalis]|uniref:hypothetical protein n=1 Tax=Burkholderia stagnalis TaxID=1503054 RepID=UPI000F5633BF|nr:hypothetical protein [Burkholderia stagnalis]